MFVPGNPVQHSVKYLGKGGGSLGKIYYYNFMIIIEVGVY
jgi:hypothetical protein